MIKKRFRRWKHKLRNWWYGFDCVNVPFHCKMRGYKQCWLCKVGPAEVEGGPND